MRRIAVKILLGDRAKYLGLVFGVTFATLLMAQQVSIFVGLMSRTAGSIFAVTEADIWVMDKRVRYIEEVEPMRDIELSRIRAVPGVQWAVPFYKGLSTIRMPDGLTQQVQLFGIDDVSLVGMCNDMVQGRQDTIRRPQSAAMDLNGFFFTWPGEQPRIGKYIELNDRRLKIDAICDARPNFFTFPMVFVSYKTAMEITPPVRNKMPFVLVKAAPGVSVAELTKRIEQDTQLQALSRHDFAWRSINYILERTGIPINFGITIVLGVVIGIAITAQTFNIFVVENLRQFAAMKAIGVTNRQLFSIVLTQAGIVGITGYGLGIGFTAFFFAMTADVPALKGFILHWQVMAGAAAAIAAIVLFSILFSLRRVFTIDPALVFRG